MVLRANALDAHIGAAEMKKKTSITLSQECINLIAKLCESNGLSRSSMIEVLVRAEVKREGAA